ncbi:MAG: CPBP family glutamic-type intramembrane protease, partial [Chloroflexota bacterium]
FVTAVAAGYAVAGIWLGYVTGFYTIASQFFGAWSPAEVPYSDVMTTLLPWLYPLTTGFGAAISEEFTFRLFAVPLFLLIGWAAINRLAPPTAPRTRRKVLLVVATVIAVVLPAAIWGSLHSTYPQQPFFIRATELTIVGSLSALLMFRYGIFATITSHYVYNSSVIGGLFLLSGSTYLQASAVVVILLPFAFTLPAIVARARGLKLQGNAELTPQPLPLALSLRGRREDGGALSLWTPRNRRLLELGLAGVICLGLALAWSVPRLGDDVRMNADAQQTASSAKSMVDELGLDAKQWQTVTTFEDWSLGDPTTYLLRQLGTAATSQYLSDQLPGYLWQTRFYQELQKEEIAVRYDQNGRLQSFDHQLSEDAPGDRLSRGQAQALAEAFVRKYGKASLLNGNLVVAASTDRKARTDHTFVWEDESAPVGEAKMRLHVVVSGGAVSQYLPYLKIPEAFQREMAKQTEADFFVGLARQAMETAVLVIAMVAFIVRFRRDQINIRFAAGAAGLLAGLSLVGTINGLPTIMAGYWTTIDVGGYLFWRLISVLQDVGWQTVWYFVLFAVAESLYRERFPTRPGLTAQIRAAVQGGRASLAAGLFALAAAPVVMLLFAAYRAAREFFAAGSLTYEATVPGGLFNVAWPALDVATGNLSFALWLVLGSLAITLWLWGRLRRPALVAAVWALALTLLYINRLEEWQMVLVDAARWTLTVGVIYLAVARYARLNLVAYGVAVYTFFAARDALFLVAQPGPGFAVQGALALALALLPALFLVWRGLRPVHAAAEGPRPDHSRARFP